jgi:hypothetical protein
VSSGTGPGQISSKSIAIVNSLKPARYHQRLYPRKPGEQGTDVGWIIGSCLFLASFCFSFFFSLPPFPFFGVRLTRVCRTGGNVAVGLTVPVAGRATAAGRALPPDVPASF